MNSVCFHFLVRPNKVRQLGNRNKEIWNEPENNTTEEKNRNKKRGRCVPFKPNRLQQHPSPLRFHFLLFSEPKRGWKIPLFSYVTQERRGERPFRLSACDLIDRRRDNRPSWPTCDGLFSAVWLRGRRGRILGIHFIWMGTLSVMMINTANPPCACSRY